MVLCGNHESALRLIRGSHAVRIIVRHSHHPARPRERAAAVGVGGGGRTSSNELSFGEPEIELGNTQRNSGEIVAAPLSTLILSVVRYSLVKKYIAALKCAW